MLSRKFLRIQVHRCLRTAHARNDPEDPAASEPTARDLNECAGEFEAGPFGQPS